MNILINTYDLLWIINIQWLCTSSRTTSINVLNNETIKIHCCLWLTFWILNNTHNAPLLSRGLPQVTFDLPGTCWIQIKCRFVLLWLSKLNPSTAKQRCVWRADISDYQSQYISKKVWALHQWRWACGTCCKQYHMLFKIQMASSFPPSFPLLCPFFLIPSSNTGQINGNKWINQPIPSKTLNLQQRNQYPPSPGPHSYYTPYPLPAIKIGNPTSQCALLG